MSKKNEAWGVEVGAQAIKVMKLGRSGSGVVLEDFEVMPFKHVLTTPDLNVEEAIRVNLESLAQKHEFEKSTVVVSVPGHMAFARFAKLPPIESSKVKSIVAYEAQQQIPFPIDEVEWDYHVFEEEDAPDIEVGIFAITKEKVAHFLSNYRSVGLAVDKLTLSPVAVHNAFAYDAAEDAAAGSTVYLDIGTVSTDIIVVEDGGIWLRTLPLGGNHFTNALMKQFKISFAKAEKLKLEAGTSKYAKQIFQAMRGVFSDLVSEIQRSLGFYQSLNRDAELTRIVGVGSTWKLPGLQKFLKQNLQMDVVRPDGFGRLEIDGRRAAEFSSVAVNMATAYGLALQGLGMASVDANILPQTILRQRMWKAKQPLFGAAAACVVGAAAVGGVMMLMKTGSFDAAYSDSFQRDITETLGDAQQYKTRYNEEVVANDPRPGIRNFRRSFDYANLYPKLLEDVSEAMATIEPHEALKNADWNSKDSLAAIAAVDRKDRRQVWITSVTTQYEMPDTGSEEDLGTGDFSDPGGEFEDFGGEDFGGEFDEFGEFGGGDFAGGDFSEGTANASLTPVPFPEQESFEEDDPFAEDPLDDGGLDGGLDDGGGEGEAAETPEIDPEDNPAPRIIVTVRGETTMDGSTISGLLRDNFVGWMKEHAERDDRPYIIVAKLTDTKFRRRGITGGQEGGGGGGEFGEFGGGDGGGLRRTPTPKQDLGTPGLGEGGLGGPLIQPGGGEFGEFGDFGGSGEQGNVEVKTPEGWYAPLAGSSTGFSVGALLPKRPLSVEDDSEDYLFTFQFEVILLSPDEARKTILPANETDTAPDDAGEPTANIPAPILGQEDQS